MIHQNYCDDDVSMMNLGSLRIVVHQQALVDYSFEFANVIQVGPYDFELDFISTSPTTKLFAEQIRTKCKKLFWLYFSSKTLQTLFTWT